MSEQQSSEEQPSAEERKLINDLNMAVGLWDHFRRVLMDRWRECEKKHRGAILVENIDSFKTVITNPRQGSIAFRFETEHPPRVYRHNEYPGNSGVGYLRFGTDLDDGSDGFYERRLPPKVDRFVSFQELADECFQILRQAR